ncbi:hypothetical protein L198_00890 [Cryptococcus wingfieldii CBS 7118]|uniref:Zn(2)-C6 fungal-type domain-containing protein n=1 Tax=Cryptococcus wingfieldii CBS 7118 TaxID=1295528 RepID=A0A1E3K2S0_9TREE|nr:hypothetical protein L198_00890 [Cryptococcus wingfieldii CBS 7118]ODO07311.1 hypothetical protein L198_00890 [Cryptococcus wingfieldii CBS 7118]
MEPLPLHASHAGPAADAVHSPIKLEQVELEDTASSSQQGSPIMVHAVKVEKEETPSKDAKVKKTRQSQSCDACRARKVKCDRPPPGTVTNAPTKDICSHCSQLSLECRFDYVPRKRGPPNLYLKRLQEDQQAAASRKDMPYPSLPPSLPPPQLPQLPIPAIMQQGPATAMPSTATMGNPNGGWQTASPIMGMQPLPLPQVSYLPPMPVPPAPIPTQSYMSSPMSHRGHIPPPVEGPRPMLSSAPPSAHSSPAHLSPNTSFGQHSYEPRNPLDAVVPRPILYHIINLYFDYVYCLIPCLHRPSFTHDLDTNREERPGEEEWVALVLSVVASTLVQLPRSFISMRRKEVKELVLRCHQKVRSYLAQDYQHPTITRSIILYINIYVYSLTDRMSMARADFGTNYAYTIALQSHLESEYTNHNPVESSLRRRMFWLMYGADKTFSAIAALPLYFHEDDCASVALPEDLDDAYISTEGRTTQPEGCVSPLCGFRYVSYLYRLTGEALDKQSHDKLRPPSGVLLQMRLSEVSQLYHRVMSAMDGCPQPLVLNYSTPRSSVASLSPDWGERMKTEIHTMFVNPKGADMELVKDYYLVQQANIYVTQQLVRFIIIQYRDELLEHQEIEQRQVDPNDIARREEIKRSVKEGSQDEREQVVVDLLSILRKIPIKVLAVNSISLVQKVRLVASSLLDSLNPEPEGSSLNGRMADMHTESRAERAQKNLWSFLSYLSEIETLYSWDDDVDT